MKLQRHRAILFAIALSLMPCTTSLAQSVSQVGTSSLTAYEVTQIAGLPDAKPDMKGHLTLTAADLFFTNASFNAEIPFTRITSVSEGAVRIETGGTTGRIARAIIPYGGGLAVATVTQKTVELLTIEYLDLKGGYHGAVFYVPKSSAKTLSDRISSQLSPFVPQPSPSCKGQPQASSLVIVEPIAASGVELPAEYRVLLYEGIVNQLRASATSNSYIRAGSVDGSRCSAMKLNITVTGFSKGNQALRAETGPIGMFVGKTTVSVHVQLVTADGHSVLSDDMTNSKRMDTQSLGVADSVAKAVSKKIRKLSANKSAG